MATMSQPPQDLQGLRDSLKSRLMSLGDMRPGSLVERYRRCGKPSCHCAAKDSPGHGPSWSLTRPVHGKTVTKVIPTGPAVERTRAQIAEYKRFRAMVQQLVEVNEKLCDTQIAASRAGSDEGAEKKGSKRPFKWRSSRRSKSS